MKHCINKLELNINFQYIEMCALQLFDTIQMVYRKKKSWMKSQMFRKQVRHPHLNYSHYEFFHKHLIHNH